jgi:hypothetical protein
MGARQGRCLLRVIAVAVGAAAMLTAAGPLPAQAETETRSGSLSITSGWTSKTFDRNPVVLPFTVTAPCTTTDYGSGFVSTNCDLVQVDLVHPSSPASIDSDIVLTNDSGNGSGSLSLHGFMLKGFGAHKLRATSTKTGETIYTTVTLKALTRTSATMSRTRKAPFAATLRVTAKLTAFDGYSWTAPAGRYALTLQRKAGTKWVAVSSVTTANGTATWSIKVKAKATYRVCHLADAASIASCTSARTV